MSFRCTFLTLIAWTTLLPTQPLTGGTNDQDIVSKVGRVTIGTGAPTELIATVDLPDDPGGYDGKVDEWYVLASREPFTEFSEDFESAEIIFGAGRLRIISRQTRAVIDFLVIGKTAFPSVAARTGFEIHTGHGLSHFVAETTVPLLQRRVLSLDEQTRAATGWTGPVLELTPDVEDPNPDPGGGGGGSCASGGVGSTSCSVQSGIYSCSVTCQTGFYACCNTNTITGTSCKCIQNP